MVARAHILKVRRPQTLSAHVSRVFLVPYKIDDVIRRFSFMALFAEHSASICLTPELSDHGQRQDGLAFSPSVHRCPWFAPVIGWTISSGSRIQSARLGQSWS